jgi:hypothetical protein
MSTYVMDTFDEVYMKPQGVVMVPKLNEVFGHEG